MSTGSIFGQASRGGQNYVIGVDVGGTNIQAAVVDDANRIIGRAHALTQPPAAAGGLDHVIRTMVSAMHSACAEAGLTLDSIDAVGVACAGAIDLPRGMVLTSPNLGWVDVPLRDLLQNAIQKPVVLENDVNGAVWGEYCMGLHTGEQFGDLLGVWVGTGVGGGLVINGRIYAGDFFTAGEIGHTIITPDDQGGFRTIEDHCSRTGLRKKIGRALADHPGSPLARFSADLDKLGMRELGDAYRAGCTMTTSIINRSAELLGIAIANWVTMLAFKTVLIGGGVTEALGEPYLNQIRAAFEANVFPDQSRGCQLRATKLMADAGLLGAALLARELRRS